jgi:hypothetical protein
MIYRRVEGRGAIGLTMATRSAWGARSCSSQALSPASSARTGQRQFHVADGLLCFHRHLPVARGKQQLIIDRGFDGVLQSRDTYLVGGNLRRHRLVELLILCLQRVILLLRDATGKQQHGSECHRSALGNRNPDIVQSPSLLPRRGMGIISSLLCSSPLRMERRSSTSPCAACPAPALRKPNASRFMRP